MSDLIDVDTRTSQLTQTPVMQPLASVERQQVCAALAIAQGQFRTPKRTKSVTVKGRTKDGREFSYSYNYAPLDEILDCVKDPLAANGIARQQYISYRGNQPFLRTILWHISGEWMACDYPIYLKDDGQQGFAGGVTFARRYGLSLITGLAPEDDDDGNATDGNVAATSTRQPRNAPRTSAKTRSPDPVKQPIDEDEVEGSEPTWLDQLDEKLSSEPNGTKWLKLLDAEVAHVPTKDDAESIGGLASIAVAYTKAPTIVQDRINDILRKAIAKFDEPIPSADHDFMDAEETA